MTAVQNSVDRRHMGVATASVTFFRSMGGAIGTALLGAILNIRLQAPPERDCGAAQGHPARRGPIKTNDVTAIQALPEPIKSWVLEAFTRAMDDVFLVAVPFMAVAFVIALTMREKPLRGRGAASRFCNDPARRLTLELRLDGTLGPIMRTLTFGWHIGYSVGLCSSCHPDVGMLMPTRRMRRLSGAAGAVLLATTLAACGGSPGRPSSD